MPDIETEKKSSRRMERVLLLIIIPILFTVIITVVLLSVMDRSMLDSVLRTANKIPVIEKIVPSPKSEVSLTDETETKTPVIQEEEYQELMQLLDEKEQELNAIHEENQSNLALISLLNEEIEKLEQQLMQNVEQTELSEEEYEQKIYQVSRTYTDMMPSRAATIMQNLTHSEIVLLLEQMSASDQSSILQKLPPTLAAEVSILLKDSKPAKDRQIAALQDRIDELLDTETIESDALSKQELSQTIASMSPGHGALLLLRMNDVDPNQVLSILRLMDISSRSAILSAMSDASEETTAQITSRLGS